MMMMIMIMMMMIVIDMIWFIFYMIYFTGIELGEYDGWCFDEIGNLKLFSIKYLDLYYKILYII